MRSKALFLPLVAFLLVAGCLENETRLSASGMAPRVAHGYGYDGNLTASEGTIAINVVDESNTGRVVAQWEDAGAWSLDWSNFTEAADKPYQDGGIVFGVEAHGDSGNGDANIPLVHYVAAGWGVGSVQRNGQDFVDPLTKQPEFRLHFMALAAGIRDPVSHQITKADGSKPYDPKSPADGLTHEGNPEVLLLIQSTMPGTAARELVDRTINGTANEAEYAAEFKLQVPEGANRVRITLNLTSTTAGPAIVGQLTFRLLAPDGTSLAAGSLGGVTQTRSLTLQPGQIVPGENVLEVRGRGANLAYAGLATVDVAATVPFVRLLTFEGADIRATGPNAG